jgi:hypothetical protein
MKINHPKIALGLSVFYLIVALILLLFTLFSCRTVKESTSTRINTDSLVTHVKDSLTRVHTSEVTELKKMIEEMTSAGVTFVTVDSCPERESVLALLDSAGKERYKAIELAAKVKELSSKVTISEKGAITAEGKIKAAYFTSSRMESELFRVEKTNDSLRHVIETDSIKYAKQIAQEANKKKKSSFPWWMVWAAGAVGVVVGWIAKSRLSILKLKGMNKVTMFLLAAMTMLLGSCGHFHDDPGTSVWAEGAFLVPTVLGILAAIFTYQYFYPGKNKPKNKLWLGGAALMLLLIVLAIWYFNSPNWA